MLRPRRNVGAQHDGIIRVLFCMFQDIINSKSKTFFAFCFSFLLGIFVMSLVGKRFDFVYLYISLCIAVSLIIIAWSHRTVRWILLCVFCILLGISRYTIAFPSHSPSHISYYNGSNKSFTARVAREPDVREDGARYIVEMQNAEFKMQNEDVKGKIYLKMPLYPRYQYGEVLNIQCILTAPEPIDDFRYDMYLARSGVWSTCRDPEVESLGKIEGNAVLGKILIVKSKIHERIGTLWHEPYASFMAGILYGYRGGVGNMTELFNRTGVSHIVAISGYNISIIASMLMAMFMYLLIPRKKAFWLIVSGITLFVIFTGASASVVRAGIMGILTLVATQLGRMSRMGNVLTLAAGLMALHNPFILRWDAGFQLSFAATMGIVYLVPLVRERLDKMPEVIGLKESFITTIAAIIATLPLILYQFGRISFVAPLVNVLILWIIPWLMLFGALSVGASFIFSPLGTVIGWITWVGIKYVMVIVTWFGQLPFASFEFRTPWWMMITLYCGIIVAFIWQRKKLNYIIQ